MFEWNVEDMVLMNQKRNFYIGKEMIYDCEDISKEEKIAFVDSMQDGKLSYILSLADKYNAEKENLSKDRWGNVRTVSLKAWLKKNDTKYSTPFFDNWYHYGTFNFLGTYRNIECIHRKGAYDTYENLIDEVFHRQLKSCKKEEQIYFSEHDEYSILKKEFINRNYGTTFGVSIVMSGNNVYVGDFDKKREITIDELKELLAKYEQLDALVEKLTAETHISY